MKVLSLTQPWATLVALGHKKIETRSWYSGHRGELLIHAAKGFPGWAKETCDQPEFCQALHSFNIKDLPRGVILCRVELVAVVSTDKLHLLKAAGIEQPSVKEIAFGDYSHGRFAWAMRLLETYETPIPAKGALGLWEFPQP